MGRCIGLDVHRDFAQVAIWENERTVVLHPMRTGCGPVYRSDVMRRTCRSAIHILVVIERVPGGLVGGSD